MRILATLLRPTAGRARVLGHDVVAEPLAVRRRIGLAGQFAAVDAELTGRENVEMIARLYRLPGAEARRRASEVLERFGLAEAGDRRVSTYSLIVLLIGLVVGFKPSQPIYDVVLAFALVLAFAYVFSWSSSASPSATPRPLNPSDSSGVVPLVFASSAFVPTIALLLIFVPLSVRASDARNQPDA